MCGLQRSVSPKSWYLNFSFSSIPIVVVVLASLVIAPALAANGQESLSILLTNDDGWDAVGIQTMKGALEAAGHEVTLVAPATDSSGSSGAVTLDLVPVAQPQPGEYAVQASPASCVILGLTAILTEVPDLVVSGINEGVSLGMFTPVSGTVGAATAALLLGVPSIAVGTEGDYQDAAEFIVQLIEHLQSKAGSLAKEEGLLPTGLGLKVDYPPLDPDEIEGVKLSVQGKGAAGSLSYIEIAPGLFIPNPGPPPNVEEVKNADISGYYDGFITIVPIDGNYTASHGDLEALSSVINGLSP